LVLRIMPILMIRWCGHSSGNTPSILDSFACRSPIHPSLGGRQSIGHLLFLAAAGTVDQGNFLRMS
jgi:hypothetical protein